jgi:uncharacterized OB-fold protein
MSASPARTRPTRPAPIRTFDNDVYWQGASDGRLVGQRCGSCSALHHPPRPMCPHCHSLDLRPEALSGDGAIYSYAILHHPQLPAFDYPVIAVLVDLVEGVRVVSNLVGVDPADVRIDMPVRVTFAPTVDDGAVPVFEPRQVDA